ncbi:hypothetical protein D3C71_1712300 [compost metagenome]
MQYLSNRSTELQMWAENIAIAIRPGLHEWGGRLLDFHYGQLASLREKQVADVSASSIDHGSPSMELSMQKCHRAREHHP